MCVAPKPAFKPLVEQKEPSNEKYTEVRVSKEKDEKINVGTFAYCFEYLCCVMKQIYIQKRTISETITDI